MTKGFAVDGILLPDGAVLMEGGNTRLSPGIGGLPSAAWYCEPGIGTINIDDPDGDYAFAGWHTFTVEDSDCTRSRVWSGWLIGRRIMRGPYRSGPGRVWEVQIIDINALFGFQVFRANSAQRPAETDLARIAWAIASAPMATTPVHDDGRISAANPANLSDAQFVRSYPVDLFANAAGQSGKNVFAYWDHDALDIGLSYEKTTEWPTSTVIISNDQADVDASPSDTFYPFLDAELAADAYGTYTGTLLDYVTGSIYGENQDLIDDLSPTQFSPEEFKRDQVIRSDRISKLDTANAFLQSYLASAATEKEEITLGVRIPASLIGFLEAGMLISVKLVHLPGLETFTTLPIIRRSAVPTPNRTDTWDVRIQLSTNVKPAEAPGGDPGGTPFDGSCSGDVAFVQSAHAVIDSVGGHVFDGASWPAPPTEGNLLVSCWGFADGQTAIGDPMPGWTFLPHDTQFSGTGGNGAHPLMFWKIATDTEDTTPTINTGSTDAPDGDGNHYLIEYAGISSLHSVVDAHTDTGTADPGSTVTPPAGVSAIIVTFLQYHTTLHGSGTPTAGTTELYEEGVIGGGGAANPQHWVGYRLVTTTSGSPYDVNPGGFTGAGVKWGSITAAWICDSTPPTTGGHVFREVVGEGDGTTTTFNTRFSYAPGSLHVFVDGVEIINGLTETNNVTGEFTLDFAPQGAHGDTRAEIITARYQGV